MPSSGLPAACCAPPAPLAQTAAPAAAGEPAHGAAISVGGIGQDLAGLLPPDTSELRGVHEFCCASVVVETTERMTPHNATSCHQGSAQVHERHACQRGALMASQSAGDWVENSGAMGMRQPAGRWNFAILKPVLPGPYGYS
eukprot:scaffold135551_cov20-Tisochrysis_lutea.AAC.1